MGWGWVDDATQIGDRLASCITKQPAASNETYFAINLFMKISFQDLNFVKSFHHQKGVMPEVVVGLFDAG